MKATRIGLTFRPDDALPWGWTLPDFDIDDTHNSAATDREAVHAALTCAAEIQAREYDAHAQKAHETGRLVKALAEAAEKAKG